jgi:hypothetical protein
VSYEPRIFTDAASAVAPQGKSTAQAYLQQRYVASTETFAPLAILLLALLAYAIVTLFPSVLAELSVIRNKDRKPDVEPAADATAATDAQLRSGCSPAGTLQHRGAAARPLAHRRLPPRRRADARDLPRRAVVSLAVLYVFMRPRDPGGAARHLRHVAPDLAGLSKVWLAPLVFGAAGLAAALSLLGGLLSRYAPAVRAPLDVALDVDNYFREFPRKQIPRARIFARYVACSSTSPPRAATGS